MFNLGLDEDEHLRLEREETHGMSNPAGGITSMSVADSRPDALDLALMAFTASASKGRGFAMGVDTTRVNPEANSPFCDAVIRQNDVREHRATNGNVIKNAEERSRVGTILPATNSPLPQQRDAASSLVCNISPSHDLLCGSCSPRATNENPGESPTASHENKGESTTTTVVVSPQIPGSRPLAGDHIAAKQGGDSSPWGSPPSIQPSFLRSLVETGPGGSIHPRERFEALEAIALNIEKKRAPSPTVDHAFASYPGPVVNRVDGSKDQRAPLEDDKTGSGVERCSPFTIGDTDKEELDEKTCEVGGLENEDDLLAKASELHLSVAVQLRSVKELLKRKSFMYIDTSWSARRLPCPPIAWKGKQSVNPPKIIDAVADEAVRNPFAESTYATTEKQANVFVRLEGHWASPVATKLRVSIHSIPGEKVCSWDTDIPHYVQSTRRLRTR